jgi:hypothetical protein
MPAGAIHHWRLQVMMLRGPTPEGVNAYRR